MPPPGEALDLSVVVPVFDEEENLPALTEELKGALGKLGKRYEVIFVDDGSRDRSFEILKRARASFPQLRLLRFRQNRGQSAAFAAGFRAARGALVVTLDADLQNDPRDIPKVLAALSNADAVAGIRKHREDTLWRRLQSRVGNAVRNALTGDEIVDTGCSLKGFRREALARVPYFKNMHRFLPTLVGIAGGRVVQVEVGHRPRGGGRSKYGMWGRAKAGLADALAVRWMKRRRLEYEVVEEVG